MSEMEIVPLELIKIGQRLRKTEPEQVERLMASINETGLMNPITVCRSTRRFGYTDQVDAYQLVAGAHRLEAFRLLGREKIPVHIVDLSELERQIAECDENLCGTKLTPSERALFIRRRKQAYEALHPETRQGVAGAKAKHDGASDKLSFADDAAEKTGVSARTIQRDAVRGLQISDEILKMIRGTPLDTGAYLDKIRGVPHSHETVKKDLAWARKKAREAKKKDAARADRARATAGARAARQFVGAIRTANANLSKYSQPDAVDIARALDDADQEALKQHLDAIESWTAQVRAAVTSK